MKVYEGFFVLPPDATADARKNQLAALENSIQKAGGKITQRQELGRRPLGYMIRKFKDGYMICWDFEMDPASQEGFRRTIELQEDIIKYMITNKVAPSENAAAAQAKPASSAAVGSRPALKKAPTSTQKVSAN